MSEGLFDGVLGSEPEKSEAETPETLAGAEAFAAAVAARLSGNDPGVARKTEVFLEEQARLLATQRQHLEDEHALRVAHLAHQQHLLRGQRLSQAIRLSFQIVIALVVLVIGAGIAVMLHDAFTSHDVVIDAFDAPAALAAQGVTGKVVAGDVLDALTRLQDATGGSAAPLERSLSGAWSNQFQVEVPETGVSLGEISRLLRGRFGHDLHIGGALVQTDSGGLALTVRGDNIGPKTFTGGAGTLERLATQAAQYLYSQSEPALWASYLSKSGRCPEDLAFIRSTYDYADPRNRPYLLNYEGQCTLQTGGSLSDALALWHRAHALEPHYWAVYFIEQFELAQSGADEQAWSAAHSLRQAAGGEPGAAPRIYFAVWDALTGDFQAEREAFLEDLQRDTRSEFLPRGLSRRGLAMADVHLHDPHAAELMLQNAPLSVPTAFNRALVAEESGDAVTAAKEVEAAFAGGPNPHGLGAIFGPAGLAPGDDGCAIAPIEEAAGHPDRADAILSDPSGTRYLDCQRFRGDILDDRGDWAGAQQAYAHAVALAPDLPAGYYSWGVALARHGDLAGALAKLQAANQRGPHWADPLKAWGDVLAKQGHWKGALAKYDEALRYAPNWAALKQARAVAAAKTRA